MICGTTPNIICNVNVDLRTWDHIRMTISDKSTTIDLNDSDLEITETTVSALLAQEQTLMFKGQYVEVQLKAKHGDRVAATQIRRVPLSKIICGEVI